MTQHRISVDARFKSQNGTRDKEGTMNRATADGDGGPTAIATGALSILLRNRTFATFEVGSFVNVVGSYALIVAIGWMVVELTGSSFLLGLTNFASMFPILLLALPAGALADRIDRRLLILIPQAVAAVAVVLLAIAAAIGTVTLPMIFAIALIAGLCNAITWPTWSVLVRDIVGPEQLRIAIAVDGGRDSTARIIGPALAGRLLAVGSAALCLQVGAAMVLALVVVLSVIRVPRSAVRTASPIGSSLVEGLAVAWASPTVRRLLIRVGTLGLLVIPHQALLPSFVKSVLGSGPETLGALFSAAGVGAVVGAFAAGAPIARRHSEAWTTVTPIVAAAALVVFATSSSLPIALAAIIVVALAGTGFMVVARASVQLAVEPGLAGRVMGLFTLVFAGSQPIGALAQGALADWVSLPTTMACAGLIAIAALSVAAFTSRCRA